MSIEQRLKQTDQQNKQQTLPANKRNNDVTTISNQQPYPTTISNHLHALSCTKTFTPLMFMATTCATLAHLEVVTHTLHYITLHRMSSKARYGQST
jgi:hypothetical protein